MKLERSNLVAVLSEALDSVEKELLGVTDHHAKRVAILCIRMAEQLEMPTEERASLAISALLHDSALSEYREGYHDGKVTPDALQGHCTVGEENLRYIPGEVSRNFVLYHHERADGSGPFGKTAEETPLGAQLLHIADQTDRAIPMGMATEADLAKARAFIEVNRGTLFAEQPCLLMERVLTQDL